MSIGPRGSCPGSAAAGRHLARVEQADRVAVPAIDGEGRVFEALIVQQPEIVGIIVADGLDEIEIAPAALRGKRLLPGHRAAAEDFERDALLDVVGVAIDAAEPVGAHRAWPFALRAEHPEIGDERIMIAEQIGEADILAILVAEAIILVDHRPRRQRLALFGKPGEMAADLDLLGQQRPARAAAYSALSSADTGLTQRGEILGGLQRRYRPCFLSGCR